MTFPIFQQVTCPIWNPTVPIPKVTFPICPPVVPNPKVTFPIGFRSRRLPRTTLPKQVPGRRLPPPTCQHPGDFQKPPAPTSCYSPSIGMSHRMVSAPSCPMHHAIAPALHSMTREVRSRVPLCTFRVRWTPPPICMVVRRVFWGWSVTENMKLRKLFLCAVLLYGCVSQL